jgi:predicted secreted protein
MGESYPACVVYNRSIEDKFVHGAVLVSVERKKSDEVKEAKNRVGQKQEILDPPLPEFEILWARKDGFKKVLEKTLRFKREKI